LNKEKEAIDRKRGGRDAPGWTKRGSRGIQYAPSRSRTIVPESERDDYEVRYQVFDDPNTVPEPVDFVD
jgi:hypothetical protein